MLKDIEIYELAWDKEILKKRIKTRTKEMLDNGLLDEAKILFSKI